MKQKSRTCSTGHDTGATFRRGLRESLQQGRVLKFNKMVKRLVRLEARATRISPLSSKSSVVLMQRTTSLLRKATYLRDILTRKAEKHKEVVNG